MDWSAFNRGELVIQVDKYNIEQFLEECMEHGYNWRGRECLLPKYPFRFPYYIASQYACIWGSIDKKLTHSSVDFAKSVGVNVVHYNEIRISDSESPLDMAGFEALLTGG